MHTQNIECLFSVNIPNLSLTDEKLNLIYKLNAANHTSKLNFFSITGLSKTMIISDMVDFIKAASYSETTHVSTKQKLGVFASF